MKTFPLCSRLLPATVLIGGGLAFISVDSLSAQTPNVDPKTHAAHVDAGSHPATDAATGNPAPNQELSQLQAKIAQLEAALAKNAPPKAGAPAGATMPGMSGAAPAASPAMGKGMDQMKSGGMSGMDAGAAPAPAMAGMGGPPSGAGPGMMAMMDKMMGMMDKMMSMGGGAPMPDGGMDMDMDMMKKGGGGSMPPPQAAAMATRGMAMGKDMKKMTGMMGMGAMPAAAPGAMLQSALPGFPGASHLYHIGATGFFLDHTQHIALTTEQQAALNKAKEQALLAKSTADRAIEQAEQELWTLTASDQPDAAKIEGKIAEIAKISGNERLAFIRAVGDASKLLTDEQRKILTGFSPPVSAAAPMAPMKGM